MNDELFDILEPRKKFLTELQKTHKENVEQYFDDLVKEAKIDAGENKRICNEIYALENEIKALKAKNDRSKFGFMGLLILFFILLFAGLILIVVSGSSDNKQLLFTLGIVSLVGSVVLLIFSIVRRVTSKKKLTKAISEKTAKHEELKNKAFGMMAALNSLYEWNIYNTLMNKTVPLIKMDRIFDMNKYHQMVEKFKWEDRDDVHISTLAAQSGSILGNPFIIYRDYVQSMFNKIYTGSITITWSERVSDGKGGYRYRTRTQTLTATVSKPAPTYSSTTRLVFASEAAPKLSFSRAPMSHGYDQKSLDKFFKEAEKRVDKYIKEHPNFTPLGNDQFEDFFGGLDRDNEVEYRLLFTPLAQKAMLDLLTHQDPYGDDFSFYKKKMINTIISHHSQSIDYDGYPSVFYHFDLEKARENFIERNMNYFRGLYFDLAPLMSIPLYQQYPTDEYIFNKTKGDHFSRLVSETEANRYDNSYFAPSECVTPLILKSTFVGKGGNAESMNITAHGFKGTERVTYVTKLGGDGKSHEIPVHWIEYTPVSKVTPFTIQASDINRKQFNSLISSGEYQQFLNTNVANGAIICSRGLFSFINKSTLYSSDELDKVINKYLSK